VSVTTPSDPLGRGLLEILIYAATSARTLLDETPAYGPLRLLEVARRILDAMDAAEVGPAALQEEIRPRIDAAAASLTDDRDGLCTQLDALVSAALRFV
jgi:hypothetical protein